MEGALCTKVLLTLTYTYRTLQAVTEHYTMLHSYKSPIDTYKQLQNFTGRYKTLQKVTKNG